MPDRQQQFNVQDTSASDPIDELSRFLAEAADTTDRDRKWPEDSLRRCAEAGVFRWFVPEDFGGWNWTQSQILRGYLELSAACLTTTFIITQWQAACRRLLNSPNEALKRRLVPQLVDGGIFTTVGISHLTTSSQHLAKPILRAVPSGNGYRLEGTAPWVTGAIAADWIVLGAVLPDGNQIMLALPTDTPGVVRYPGFDLMALSASCTDRVEFSDAFIDQSNVLFGPDPNVMRVSSGGSAAAGGLQTSVLALGLTGAATRYLMQQAERRPSLVPIAQKIQADWRELVCVLEEMAGGNNPLSTDEVRRQANSLVLRATQAALQTAKGAGFVNGHPVGRWAREALFFLVWSCPQSVVDANLCELAGLSAAP